MSKIKNLLQVLCICSLFVVGCRKDNLTSTTTLGKKTSEFTSNSLNEWIKLNLDLVKTTPGYTPPVASRAFGYIGVGLYETVAPGVPNSKSMVGQLNGLSSLPSPDYTKEYDWKIATDAYFENILPLFFPTAIAAEKDSINVLVNKNKGNNGAVKADVVTRSQEFGKAIAKAIFNWSVTDVIGHEGYSKNFPAGYSGPIGDAFWQPTGAQLIPLQPYWGTVRPFMPNITTLAFPPAPFLFSTDKASTFFKDANTVYETSKILTEDQKAIAKFWADGGGTVTPPGHSVAIMNQLILENKLTLDVAAATYAKLGIGLADAFICCWKAKYTYSILRPETYIKKYIDKDWKPLIATPPFPEYVSGHATQSGAMAVILSDVFGSNYAFADKTNINRKDISGLPRLYKNIMAAATEATASRLYGGIHYPNGNSKGIQSGMQIGQQVLALKFRQ